MSGFLREQQERARKANAHTQFENAVRRSLPHATFGKTTPDATDVVLPGAGMFRVSLQEIWANPGRCAGVVLDNFKRECVGWPV